MRTCGRLSSGSTIVRARCSDSKRSLNSWNVVWSRIVGGFSKVVVSYIFGKVMRHEPHS
ncbi:hypothetical protein XFF7766_610041 [Xanthomonas citri pv. fuscans]|nr:hypothetical protein XFF7766_610041 [Xanthomonas citri pv. fuscans]